jgi:hypothetical protein
MEDRLRTRGTHSGMLLGVICISLIAPAGCRSDKEQRCIDLETVAYAKMYQSASLFAERPASGGKLKPSERAMLEQSSKAKAVLQKLRDPEIKARSRRLIVDVCKNQLDAMDRHCLEVVLLGRKKKFDVSCEHALLKLMEKVAAASVKESSKGSPGR